MNNKKNKETTNEEILRVNNQLTIITDYSEVNGVKKNYYVTLITNDINRKGNENNVNHCIKISVELMENGQLKMPSTIRVNTWILNKHENKNILNINQIGNNIQVSYSNSIGKHVKINAQNSDSDQIIGIIEEYLNSFDGLRNDENLQKGLEVITPALKAEIDEMFTIWDKFDIDEFIKQQKARIKLYELEYKEKVNPIKKQIKFFETLKVESKENKTK